MPTTTVEVALEPIPDEFTPMMDGIIARSLDMLPAYGEVYQAFLLIERKRFDAEGPGWKQLADSTVKQRGSAHPILQRTKALKASLTSESSPDAIFHPEVDGVFMGTSDPVARFHQKGTEKMPARPVVDVTEADAVTFTEIINRHLFGFSDLTTSAGTSVYAVSSMGL